LGEKEREREVESARKYATKSSYIRSTDDRLRAEHVMYRPKRCRVERDGRRRAAGGDAAASDAASRRASHTTLASATAKHQSAGGGRR
jgi:hypothetical protein